MQRKKAKKTIADKSRASIAREMAKPLMVRSARIAELKMDRSRIPEQPSISMSGTVEKIVSSPRTSIPEKAHISVDTADPHYRDLRIENALIDEHGDDVKLKRGGHVEITVTAEPKP